MKIRIKFAKYGSMKFIGHLDVMRFFQKAIRRADIDIKYSVGFSPHQIMSFAAPLGVGIESTGEYLDIEINSITSPHEMKDALNKVMVEGMEILAITVLPEDAKNAMASVAAAEYWITCHLDNTVESSLKNITIDDLKKKLSDFYQSEHIFVTKTTKKSVKELDLKPGIYSLDVLSPQDDAAVLSAIHADYIDASFVITMLINASSSGNIKPSMVLDAFCAYAQTSLPPSSYQITRFETYTNLAKEGEKPRFIPLHWKKTDINLL